MTRRADRRAAAAGPEIRFSPRGADMGESPCRLVERREAQRPGGGLRNPVTAGRARLGAGLANLLM